MKRSILGFVTAGVAVAFVFVAWVYPEVPTASYALGGLLAALAVAMGWVNQKALKNALKSRSVRYGTNAAITVALVFAILVVLNFLNFNHYYRKDLTKNKIHSLSEQTTKILKGLNQDVKLTVFAKTIERDAAKAVIDNYLYQSKKVTAEYVDPDRDPTRTKAANIKKTNTVVVSSGTRESRVEEINEEKLTNGIIKVLKEKPIQVCFMTGHGEKSFDSDGPETYSQIKQDLNAQNYESKTFNLLEEGKIPADCNVLLVLGPNRAFFEKEINVLRDWLKAGGRALFAVDPDLKGRLDANKEIKALLGEWSIEFKNNLVLDPTSRLLGQGASVPLAGSYSKDSPITKEFQITSLFPLTSTLDFKPNPPATLKTWWLAKSTPQAFAKSDFKEISTGMVKLDPKKDQAGPHNIMLAVESGKPGDKTGLTRIIALGTSSLGANQFARHGGNSDLFINSISWLADDESMISIRAKEEATQLPSLTDAQAKGIQFFSFLMVPGSVLLAGLVVWRRRKSL